MYTRRPAVAPSSYTWVRNSVFAPSSSCLELIQIGSLTKGPPNKATWDSGENTNFVSTVAVTRCHLLFDVIVCGVPSVSSNRTSVSELASTQSMPARGQTAQLEPRACAYPTRGARAKLRHE